ncbi:hypothetical protein [Microvirga puerhi]|uniref:Uncharacterized protein n=1 Tax=Microvirga puerhi TaxID=2876078 RepID=A0ABS7VRX0_9HYPH|nr:hypothetical protein [Microvirga puerhi]MBZ6078306.1 hypothetical protein [Microvirga puerhi]
MQDSLEEIAYTVGGAVVSPSIGSAELILALLVACGFLFSAFHSLFSGHHETHWQEKRHR